MARDDVHGGEMPDDLDAFLDELRQAAATTPAPVVGDALATLFREGAAPVAAPVVHRPRRGVKVLVAGLVAGIGLGSLGVAGALPGPVQRRVADVVDTVGVHLPDGEPDPTTTTTSTSTTTVASTTTTRPAPAAAPPTTAGNRGPGKAGEDHGKGKDAERGKDGQKGRIPPTTTDVDDEDGPGRGRGKGPKDDNDDERGRDS